MQDADYKYRLEPKTLKSCETARGKPGEGCWLCEGGPDSNRRASGLGCIWICLLGFKLLQGLGRSFRTESSKAAVVSNIDLRDSWTWLKCWV